MADPFTVLSIVSTVASVAGKIQQGKATEQAYDYQAAQSEVNAGQAKASAQRLAVDRKRQSVLAASRAQAVGASSGGLDPSTVDIISDIEAEGEYGALEALYEGEERARGNIAQANIRRYEGKQAKRLGYASAIGTAGSFFSKYGREIFSDIQGADYG